jgi:membrane-associated phospholipid phosphatase
MFDQLIQFDRHLFYIINHDWANPFFNSIMPWVCTPGNWIPLYILIIAFCLWKFKKQGIVIIVFIALSAGFADSTCNLIIKPLVHRVRPCRDPITAKTTIELTGCGMGYSFPSIHAADHFAVAIIMVLLFYRKWRWIWFWGILWAGLISFSRIYVGVHFPIDVFCGAIYGALVGWLFAWLFKKLQPRFPEWVPVI